MLSCKGSELGSGDNQRQGMAFPWRKTNGARTLPTAEGTTEGEYTRDVKSHVVCAVHYGRADGSASLSLHDLRDTG